MSTMRVVLLLALQVGAQLTVDDDDIGSCQSSTSEDIVNLIKESWKDLKSTCASGSSNQQQRSVVSRVPLDEEMRQIREDLNDMKSVFTSSQLLSIAVPTSSLSRRLSVSVLYIKTSTTNASISKCVKAKTYSLS